MLQLPIWAPKALVYYQSADYGARHAPVKQRPLS